MDSFQILERFFNTFIKQKAPKSFFLGMVDYIEYGNSIPEFDYITDQISALGQPYIEKYVSQEKEALKVVEKVHKEVKKYVTSKRIQDEVVQSALGELQRMTMTKSCNSLKTNSIAWE